MSDHNDDDPNIHLTIQRGLAEHAGGSGRPRGDIGDVFVRVERRRARRRNVAVLGSVGIVAVGVLGIATVGALDGNGGGAGSGGEGGVPSTTYAVGPWACTGYITDDAGWSYYESCVPAPQALFSVECSTAVPTTEAGPWQEDAWATTVAFGSVPMTTIVPCDWAIDPSAACTVMPGTYPPPTLPINTYVVQDGDDPESIAESFGVTVADIEQYNLPIEQTWSPGATIQIPPLTIPVPTTLPPSCVPPDTAPATSAVPGTWPTTTAPVPLATFAAATAPPATTSPPPTTPAMTAPPLTSP